MSALSCGCDQEALWICEAHRPAVREMLGDNEPISVRVERNWSNAAYAKDAVARFKDRLAQQEQMKDTVKMHGYGPTAAQVFCEQAVATANAVQTRDDLLNRIATLEQELAWTRERRDTAIAGLRDIVTIERAAHASSKARIAAVLATFYRAELSMSSVQPLLTLAEELNQDLAERKR